jgi:hypothetical protein
MAGPMYVRNQERHINCSPISHTLDADISLEVFLSIFRDCVHTDSESTFAVCFFLHF